MSLSMFVLGRLRMRLSAQVVARRNAHSSMLYLLHIQGIGRSWKALHSPGVLGMHLSEILVSHLNSALVTGGSDSLDPHVEIGHSATINTCVT